MTYTTIIISDIHIGMPESKYQELLAFLEKNPCENLIINGDLVDELYIKFFGRWKQKYTNTLEQLVSICKKNQTEIFYLEGNHEIQRKDISALLGVTIQKDMIYTSHNKKYYICHGQQFDRINHRLSVLSYISFFGGNLIWLVQRIYNSIRLRLGFTAQSLVTPMKRLAKFLIGGNTTIDKNIYEKARKTGCDGVICGHFHTAENRTIGKIHYLNSGEWVEIGSALIENQEGEWSIVYPDMNML